MNRYYRLCSNILILMFVLMFHYNCQLYLYKYIVKNITTQPLYDTFHDFLPDIQDDNLYNILCNKKYGVSNTIVSSFTVINIFHLLTNNYIEILSDSVITVALLFFLRSITFIITLLPPPIPCTNTPPFLMGGCGDLLYSGHYVVFTVFFYVFINKIRPNIICKILALFLLIFSINITLICRKHYSIDIWISFLLSYLMCKILIR